MTFDRQQYQFYGNHLDQADYPYVPSSTFKIRNALIELQYQKMMPSEILYSMGRNTVSKAGKKLHFAGGVASFNLCHLSRSGSPYRIGLDATRSSPL